MKKKGQIINIYNIVIRNIMTDDYSYPRSLNKLIWESYLERDLTHQEIRIIERVKMERHWNKKLVKLYSICKTINKNKNKKFIVTNLTKADGNCLFTSLVEADIGSSIESLREGIAHLMYQFRNHKNFFFNDERSLKEMFDVTNEIEYVLCDNGKVYKYSYETMCQDIADNYSWSKLPTQIILMFLSRIYKVEIKIISSNGVFINTVNAYEGVDVPIEKTIYLGHLDESHYVPLSLEDEEFQKCDIVLYKNSKRRFHEWGRRMHDARLQSMIDTMVCDEQPDKIEEVQQIIVPPKHEFVNIHDIM